jgi:hypothetical protein
MARRSSLYFPSHTLETRKAQQFGKLLTEDFAVDLERVGFYLVRNLPLINYHRFEVLSLAAQEEYDKLMEEMKGNNGHIRR